MKCPNCESILHDATYKDLDVKECPKCEGMWLVFKELDELEDEVWDEDELKGSVVLESFPSTRKCPVCMKPMKGFSYRLHDELKLEYCPDHHGFWLDKGEGDTVLTLIKGEENAEERQHTAESEWIKHLWRLQNPSYFQKMLSYIPGIKGEE